MTEIVSSVLILGLFAWLIVDDLRGNPATTKEPVIQPVGVKRGHGTINPYRATPTETDFTRQ